MDHLNAVTIETCTLWTYEIHIQPDTLSNYLNEGPK